MITTRQSIRTTTNVIQLERDKLIRWASLALPLAVSAILNLWNLAQNGFSNTYHSVAVQSMTQSYHNFFFASYDAGGFITVHKPPLSLSIQAIIHKLLDLSLLSPL